MLRRRSSVARRSNIGNTNASTNANANKNAANNILAATAGLDNWKTWAGRTSGTDDFEWWDVVRGVKRTLTHRLILATPPPPGTTCPVCFCEPEKNSSNEWYVTSSCAHAVCLDCFRRYAKSQVLDLEQRGPLKCPVCPQMLRRHDAIVALGDDPHLIQQWDIKIRDQLLRALPAYRSCPKCHKGGGFVTPECLQPHYQERQETATKSLYGIYVVALVLLVVYIAMASYISWTPSQSPLVDVFFMLAPIYVLVKSLQASQVWVATVARQAFLRPISVECPCCDEAFALPAESKQLHDDETSRWINAHTRPCPSCSVPISKAGGCNHMRCGHCQANFCWACMRLRTSCAAFACKNGAPYHNAVPEHTNNNVANRGGAPQPNESVLATIDYILNRQLPKLKTYDAAIILLALFGRQTFIVQTTVRWVMAIVAGIFASDLLSLGVLLYTLWMLVYSLNAYQHRRRSNHPHSRRRRGVNQQTASEFLLGAEERNRRDRVRNPNVMTEREMISEAMRRSIQQQ